jgi:iron(III) transport system ATP-binding protein
MLSVRQLTKQFEVPGGHIRAVRDLDLSVNEGSFFVLLGPSGCGKSTLLRCVAGLEHPESGEIRLGDQLVFSATSAISVDPEDREVAMVFQTYAVWPHMSVFENVAFPLTEAKKKRCSADQVAKKVKEALHLVRLSGFERHSAATLSGGQQQRVALARALIREPKLLLMDEPLSNLDAKLREEMRDEIKELTRSLGVTTLHVTHDQTEAMALADLMAVMHEGNILEIGQPEELYCNPGNRTVAEFLGRTNWLSGVVEEKGLVKTDIGPVRCPTANGISPGSRASLGIRPEWVELSAGPCPSGNSFPATVESRMFLGDAVLYWVRVGPSRMIVKTTSTEFSVGSSVNVTAPTDRWVVFSETDAPSGIAGPQQRPGPA